MTLRWSTWIALAGVAAWLTVAFVTWSQGAPLGHDESQYAISTRAWLAGEPERWFYLSRGMHWISAPGIWLGASEQALRFTPLLFGLGFLAATWTLARRLAGPASGDTAPGSLTAAWVIAVLASTKCIARWNTDLLSDMPSATCLLAAFAVILDEVDRAQGPRWRLVAAAPFLALAFYIRYGSVVPIAVIVVAAIAVGARTMVRRPLPVIATAAAFLVLLVPHFLHAQAQSGSPLGILLASREVPQQEYFAHGLVTYVTSNPLRLYGKVAPFIMLAGLLSIVGAARIRDKRRLLVWLVAVGSLVAMGITTHAKDRYILCSVALFLVLGVDAIVRWLAGYPARVRVIAGVVAAAALAVVWLLLVSSQSRAGAVRRKGMRATLAAAPVIRADMKTNTRCMIIGYHFTQLEWYSGCRAPIAMTPYAVTEAHAAGERVYIVRDFTPHWADAPQPELANFPGIPEPLLAKPGEVEVWGLRGQTQLHNLPSVPRQR